MHIPGRIQSFGTLLGFDFRSDVVRHAAANLSSLLPGATDSPVGRSFLDVVANPKLAHDVRGVLGLPSASQHRERLGDYDIGGERIEVAVHRRDNLALVEFEPHRAIDVRPDLAISQVRSMLLNMASHSDVTECLQHAAENLRFLTGFDRVMGYRFLAGGDGEVAAEARTHTIDPFLGLRYPAADIPQQVREIAVRMPLRIIADIDDPHVELLSEPGVPPLDLTFAHARGVSPVHVEYLQNMGVKATMNYSILVHGQLWGLFAFHHYSPRLIPPGDRAICDLFGHLFSTHLERLLERSRASRNRRAKSTFDSLETAEDRSWIDTFKRLAGDFLEVLEADGIALKTTTGTKTFGNVPESSAIDAIAALASNEVFSSESLTATGLPADQLGQTAGALVVPFTSVDGSSLIFFRNEIITEVRWAGRLEKTITYGPLGPRLHPRSSFAEYKESVQGRCREWTRDDLSAAAEIHSIVLELLEHDSTSAADDLRKVRKQQDLLIAELNHRVKNILALVRSISRQTKDSTATINEYAAAFESRIKALAFAHDLVGGRGLQQASLGELLRAELRPYETEEGRATVEGPPVALRPDAAPIMALVCHELASNAAKYGALSAAGGRLRVSWREEAGGVGIMWSEVVSRKVEPPTRRGFGLALIERAIPYELHGESSVRYHEDGLDVQMWLPHEALTRYQEKPRSQWSEQPKVKRIANLGPVRLAEDKMMQTMEMEGLLTGLGAERVDSVPDVTIARKLLDKNEYAVAILDVNLGGTTSFELAEAAVAAGVAVLFVSGYGANIDLPPTLAGVKCLPKPIDRDMLAAKLAEMNVGASDEA